jgi:hypothetical protein
MGDISNPVQHDATPGCELVPRAIRYLSECEKEIDRNG